MAIRRSVKPLVLFRSAFDLFLDPDGADRTPRRLIELRLLVGLGHEQEMLHVVATTFVLRCHPLGPPGVLQSPTRIVRTSGAGVVSLFGLGPVTL